VRAIWDVIGFLFPTALRQGRFDVLNRKQQNSTKTKKENRMGRPNVKAGSLIVFLATVMLGILSPVPAAWAQG